MSLLTSNFEIDFSFQCDLRIFVQNKVLPDQDCN